MAASLIFFPKYIWTYDFIFLSSWILRCPEFLWFHSQALRMLVVTLWSREGESEVMPPKPLVGNWHLAPFRIMGMARIWAESGKWGWGRLEAWISRQGVALWSSSPQSPKDPGKKGKAVSKSLCQHCLLDLLTLELLPLKSLSTYIYILYACIYK